METVIRVALIYGAILLGLRLLGKREFGQLSPLELVTLLLVPEIVAQAITREDNSLTNGLIGMTTLFSLVFITSMLTHKSPRAEKLLNGTPTLLVSHGLMIEKHLNQERISPGELFSEMHKAGLERLDEVRFAILESDGRIAIIPEAGRDKMQTPSSESRLTGA
jgi:uncharacterized membrane protein YcaP (DUF421 family)